jgi:hypothetical protein
MLRKDNRGFGAPAILLILLVAVVVTVVAKYVIDKSNRPATSTTSTITQPGHGTLVIKEWGVRIDKPFDTDELTYVMQAPDNDKVQRLHFSYKKLPELSSECTTEKTLDIYGLSAFGTLARFAPESTIHLASTGQSRTVADIEKDPAVSASLQRYKKVGDSYYYLAVGYNGGKCLESATVKDYLNSISSNYATAFTNPAIQDSIEAND